MNLNAQRIRDFILDFQKVHRRRPTYTEIKEALQIGSLCTVNRWVERLEKQGVLMLLYVEPHK